MLGLSKVMLVTMTMLAGTQGGSWWTEPLSWMPVPTIPAQVLYVMVLFTVTVAVMNRLLYTPVLDILEERALRISAGAEAEGSSGATLEKKAAEIASSLAQARQSAVAAVADAKGAAETSRAGTLTEARAKADARLEAATSEIEAAGLAAEKELRDGADDLARVIAGRLMGREVA